LAEKDLMMREGTIVEATLIAARPSTKNKDGERDPEMHQRPMARISMAFESFRQLVRAACAADRPAAAAGRQPLAARLSPDEPLHFAIYLGMLPR
jgi:hypothetical protein